MKNKINPAYLSAIAIISSGIMFATKMTYDIAILKDDIADYAEQQKDIKAKVDMITSALLGYKIEEVGRSGTM